MYSLALYLFLLHSILADTKDLKAWNPDDTSIVADTCRKVTEYQYTHKILEGMVCGDKREGIWKEWTADGRLKDSAVYTDGIRIYSSAAAKGIKGTMAIKGNPKQFYKDSTYECSVKVNIYHGIRDIGGDYDGVSDTVYPPAMYFGADLGAKDSFNYYFTPKTEGKYKLKIYLTGDAAKANTDVAFYERDIEVIRK